MADNVDEYSAKISIENIKKLPIEKYIKKSKMYIIIILLWEKFFLKNRTNEKILKEFFR